MIVKKYASAFFGTDLASRLQKLEVDTIIATDCATSACVRATAQDGIFSGFRSVLPSECVGDRAPGPHSWNLFDIDAKFGDVVSKKEVLDYLNSLKISHPVMARA